MTMGAEEKELFNAMAKELATIKRWVPILLFMGTIIGFAITGTRWFDNNIAQKSDIESLKKEQRAGQEQIQREIVDLKNALDSHVAIAIAGKAHTKERIDSLAKVVSNIIRKRTPGFVTEHRNRDGSIRIDQIN